jgi:hypothetical protein
MFTLRRTLATACKLCLFTLLGCFSGPRIADANWLTYNRTQSPRHFRFQAKLLKSPRKGGWTYVVMPDSATYFGYP